jgi:HNH endonuclease
MSADQLLADLKAAGLTVVEEPGSKTLLERLFAKFTVSDGCWEWTAAKTNGYGRIGRGRRGDGHVYAHRAIYEILVGPIPDGLVIDHLCRNRSCVNPDHMEIVTHKENIRRGFAPSAISVRNSVCQKGHPLSGSNLYVQPSNGKRKCKTCRLDYQREWYANRR